MEEDERVGFESVKANLRLGGLAVLVGLSLLTAAAAEPLTVDVREAQAGYDQRTGQPVLTITLLGSAREAFSRLTRDNVGRQLELRIDGKAVLTSVIRDALLAGSFQVSGHDQETYRSLADQLSKEGAKVQVEIAPN
jgi:preprotein translocase subunit SecD